MEYKIREIVESTKKILPLIEYNPFLINSNLPYPRLNSLFHNKALS